MLCVDTVYTAQVHPRKGVSCNMVHVRLQDMHTVQHSRDCNLYVHIKVYVNYYYLSIFFCMIYTNKFNTCHKITTQQDITWHVHLSWVSILSCPRNQQKQKRKHRTLSIHAILHYTCRCTFRFLGFCRYAVTLLYVTNTRLVGIRVRNMIPHLSYIHIARYVDYVTNNSMQYVHVLTPIVV